MGENVTVTDLGRTPAQRRADDRECFSEFCDIAADECQIDHIEPWSAGGPTIDSNGRAACGYHNRWRHRRTRPP